MESKAEATTESLSDSTRRASKHPFEAGKSFRTLWLITGRMNIRRNPFEAAKSFRTGRFQVGFPVWRSRNPF